MNGRACPGLEIVPDRVGAGLGEESKLVSHMVIFRSSEGKAGYHQAEALEDAVRFVERLRNSENVGQARIFRLEEVAFEYRPYFRVEVGSPGVAPAAVVGAAPPVEPVAHDGFEPPEPVEGHDGDEVGAGARKGLFSR
jgi:hypothetical protein